MHRQWRFAGKSWNFPELDIEAGAYLCAAAWLLLLPSQWVMAAIAAAAVHEMGHLIVLWLCDVAVWKIQIGATGARIETAPMQEWQEMMCALAGPLAGLILCLFWKWIPRVAIWALMQSVFNLIPIYPMDGGRILKAWTSLRRKRESLEKSVANKAFSGYNNSN